MARTVEESRPPLTRTTACRLLIGVRTLWLEVAAAESAWIVCRHYRPKDIEVKVTNLETDVPPLYDAFYQDGTTPSASIITAGIYDR